MPWKDPRGLHTHNCGHYWLDRCHWVPSVVQSLCYGTVCRLTESTNGSDTESCEHWGTWWILFRWVIRYMEGCTSGSRLKEDKWQLHAALTDEGTTADDSDAQCVMCDMCNAWQLCTMPNKYKICYMISHYLHVLNIFNKMCVCIYNIWWSVEKAIISWLPWLWNYPGFFGSLHNSYSMVMDMWRWCYMFYHGNVMLTNVALFTCPCLAFFKN